MKRVSRLGETDEFYQVNLKLVDIRSNQIVWNGQKKIKKNIEHAAASL